jgi:hypothetical protein
MRLCAWSAPPRVSVWTPCSPLALVVSDFAEPGDGRDHHVVEGIDHAVSLAAK